MTRALDSMLALSVLYVAAQLAVVGAFAGWWT